MILGRNKIVELVEKEKIISGINLDTDKQKNNPAKVELSLGDKCYVSTENSEIKKLRTNDKVIIPPNAIFLYQTFEKLNLPNNIAGKISLKMKHTAKGLLMSNQTQIDPGYRNHVFGMLYNLSDNNIELAFNESLVSLELFSVENPSEPYNGDMNEINFEKFAETRIKSSLGELQQQVIKAVKKSKNIVVILKAATGWVTFILTILAIIIAVVALKPNTFNADIKTDLNQKSEQLIELKSQIDILQRKITVIEETNMVTPFQEVNENIK